MSKKVALLVLAQLRTRVVVEVPDDYDENTTEDQWLGDSIINRGRPLDSLLSQASVHLTQRVADESELCENIFEVVNDLEVPYNPEIDD